MKFRMQQVASILVACVVFLSGCGGGASSHSGAVVNVRALRLAVIGDYGIDTEEAHDVAQLVKSWNPHYVLTTGDNNYPSGEVATIDQNIGAKYHEFIAPYKGNFGPGSDINRFFPTLGNHDWISGAQPYLDYFTLPGNERYYDVAIQEKTHLFALDSDSNEPDGVRADSKQAQWLQERLATSAACWKIVFMHHSPYSSGSHGSSEWMQWPYQAWGADVVMGGHDHTYERLIVNGLPYFVNGLGGHTRYQLSPPIKGSQRRYNQDVGAMLVQISGNEAEFLFVNRKGNVVDTHVMNKVCP